LKVDLTVQAVHLSKRGEVYRSVVPINIRRLERVYRGVPGVYRLFFRFSWIACTALYRGCTAKR